MIKQAIASLIDGKNLSKMEACGVMKSIMDGQATPAQIAGFLISLRNKGETADEIAGCALAMRDAAQRLSLKSKNIVDCVGTGGDGKNGINISTAASFVVAGDGFTVAKHGNRSISSRCGSADVLEMMGVKIDPPLMVVEESIDKHGIGFLFAPHFHPAMKNAMPVRRDLGVRTVFNVLGPLTNPAHARVQLIGVYDNSLTRKLAMVLAAMGLKAGLVVHSNGWDEITLDNKTHVSEMFDGKVRSYNWTARDFGLPKINSRHLKGGDSRENADKIIQILEGKESPVRPVVIANAAALIWIAEKALRGHKITLKEAVKRAENAIDTGAALKKFRDLAEVSHSIE